MSPAIVLIGFLICLAVGVAIAEMSE